MLDWASGDPEFRTKLLRFVDVLPTLRTPTAIGDHVRQYFRDAAPAPVRIGSELASQPLLRPVLSGVVRQTVFAMSQRFIAGTNPQEALPHLQALARDGVGHSVDLLGEATLSEAEAAAYLERYLALLETLSSQAGLVAPMGERWAEAPVVNVSVKLSALCSHFEPAAPDYVLSALRERMQRLFRTARLHGAHIQLDMEQYRLKDLTHHVFAGMVMDPEFTDWADVGIVVQAYLKDAEDDLRLLREIADGRGAPITIRLVKGAYWDEERVVAAQNAWPVPVYEEKEETDASYERCTEILLEAWPHLRPAFGTHNPRSIAQAAVKARERGLTESQVEFQMLYGMAEDLRPAVHAEGFQTRVYVPVGAVLPGMGYLVRRLLENSSNLAWFRTNGEWARGGSPSP